MGLFKRRNGQDQNEPPVKATDEPSKPPTRQANGNLENQVPLDERHANIIIVPHTKIEVPQLLKALGANRVSTATLRSDPSQHFSLFEVPDTLTFQSGRYARASEFIETGSEEPVHGFTPAAVFAPDDTLLFHIDRLGGATNVTIGLAWQQTAQRLGTDQAIQTIPEEAVTITGMGEPELFDYHTTLVFNGVEMVGNLDYLTFAKKQLAKDRGMEVLSDEFERLWSGEKNDGRTALETTDSARVSAIGELPLSNQVAATPPTTTQAAPVTIGDR